MAPSLTNGTFSYKRYSAPSLTNVIAPSLTNVIAPSLTNVIAPSLTKLLNKEENSNFSVYHSQTKD